MGLKTSTFCKSTSQSQDFDSFQNTSPF